MNANDGGRWRSVEGRVSRIEKLLRLPEQEIDPSEGPSCVGGDVAAGRLAQFTELPQQDDAAMPQAAAEASDVNESEIDERSSDLETAHAVLITRPYEPQRAPLLNTPLTPPAAYAWPAPPLRAGISQHAATRRSSAPATPSTTALPYEPKRQKESAGGHDALEQMIGLKLAGWIGAIVLVI